MTKINRIKLAVIIVALLAISGNSIEAQSKKYFSNWEKGSSPQEVGSRVAENYLGRKFRFELYPKMKYVIYPEVCAWYGGLTVADLSKNKDLSTKLIKAFDRFLGADASQISPAAHVDFRMFGSLPLEIYMQTKDRRYLEIGQGLADKQWEKTTPDGITAEARYWVDDMYMINIVQLQAYRATKDKKYLDRAALSSVAYLDKLQQPNGLFYHAPDSPYYWSRGNGWFAAGMAEMLRSMPKKHPQRERIMRGYKTMMTSLLKYQTADGLWRQLVDVPESWEETSGTGMFAFAMVTGVKEGWLDAKAYGPAARKAWLGLVKHLDADANVTDVCVGTNKGFSVQYYLDRERKTGDLHGQAPILWTASALMR